MSASIARHEKLGRDLQTLQGQGPFMRAYLMPRIADTDIAEAAWEVYEPAVPLNFAGATFGGAGFLVGMALASVVFRLLFWPFRRRRNAA
jgi:hypothetical protein